jgi:hypothetical protein
LRNGTGSIKALLEEAAGGAPIGRLGEEDDEDIENSCRHDGDPAQEA